MALEKIGIVVAALLVAGAALGRSRRQRALALAGAMLLTPVALLADVWDTVQVRELRDRPAVVAVLAVLAVAVIVAGAALAMRHPPALALAAAAALPFRVPLEIGGETANLLVPLYVVIAAGGVAHVVSELRRGQPDPPRRPRALEWLLFGFVVLYAAQAAYSADASQAVQHLAFFYIPFGVLLVLLTSMRWTGRLLAGCLAILVALALVFCAVAFVEEATRHVLLNDKLVESNTYNPYFRANSLFFDPNIFGRFLVVVMLLVVPVAAWPPDVRRGRLAAGVLVVLWVGLLTTLSQSSFGALLVGLAVLMAVQGAGRRLVLPAAAVVAAGVVFVIAFPGAVGLQVDSAGSVRKATSGRSDLVSGGADLFAERPVLGWGAGAFPKEYERRKSRHHGSGDLSASHTIPLTVAVEQGVVGLLAYLALLVAAFATLLRGARDALPRAAVGAAFAALVLHSFGYAAFLEDPMTWAIVALGLALAGGSSAPPRLSVSALRRRPAPSPG